MRDDEQAVAGLGEALDDLGEGADGGGVAAEGGFVEDDPGWAAGDGGGEGDAFAEVPVNSPCSCTSYLA
jgi:hypothetical protein